MRRTGGVKGFPWRVVLRAANKKGHDCRWQSYLFYAGATSVATDEVEAKMITIRWYDAVTFDLIRSG